MLLRCFMTEIVAALIFKIEAHIHKYRCVKLMSSLFCFRINTTLRAVYWGTSHNTFR